MTWAIRLLRRLEQQIGRRAAITIAVVIWALLAAFAVSSAVTGHPWRAMLYGWCGGVDWLVLTIAAFFPQFDWGRRWVARALSWLTGISLSDSGAVQSSAEARRA